MFAVILIFSQVRLCLNNLATDIFFASDSEVVLYSMGAIFMECHGMLSFFLNLCFNMQLKL